MNNALRDALLKCETDVDGAISRFSGDEALYMRCLDAFLGDQTITELDEAIKAGDWDEAFTAAHALKGLTGNMGFVPLYQAAAEMVLRIRAGRVSEVDGTYQEIKRCYRQIVNAIIQNQSTDA